MAASTDASITIGADASVFSHVVEQCNKKMTALGQSIAGAFAPAGSIGPQAAAALGMVATAAAAATAAVAALGAGIAKAVSASAKFEVDSLAFRAFFTGKEQADAFVESLRQIKQETTHDAAQFDLAAKTLLRMGLSADEVADALRQMDSLAYASGKSVDQLAEAFRSLQAKGVNNRTLNALGAAGFDAKNALMQQYGMSDAAFSAAVSAGRFSIRDVMGAMRQTAAVQQDLHGQAASTYSSAMGTLGDEITRLWESLGRAVMEALKQPLADVTAALKSCGPLLSRIGSWLGEAVATAWAGLKKLVPLGQALWEIAAPLASGVQSMLSALGELYLALNEIFKPLRELQIFVLKLALGGLKLLAQGLGTLYSVISRCVRGIASAVKSVTGLFSGGGEKTDPQKFEVFQQPAASGPAAVNTAAFEDAPDATGSKTADKMREALAARRKELREAEVAAMETADQIRARLSDVGAASLADLADRLRYWEEQDAATASEDRVERYKELAAAMKECTALQAKMQEQERARADAFTAAEEAYKQQAWNAEYAAMSTAEQRRTLDAMAEKLGAGTSVQGVTDAILQAGPNGNEKHLEQLRKLRDLYTDLGKKEEEFAKTRAAAYTEQINTVEALRRQILEASGDTAAVAEMDRKAREKELMRQGMSAEAAGKIADIEQRLNAAQKRQGMSYNGSWVASSGYSSGLGGGSLFIRNADNQLQQAKAQTGHLKSLLDELRKVENLVKKQNSIPVTA